MAGLIFVPQNDGFPLAPAISAQSGTFILLAGLVAYISYTVRLPEVIEDCCVNS